MIKKISYERRVYESVDDISLSKAISQKTDEKNKSCNKGLTLRQGTHRVNTRDLLYATYTGSLYLIVREAIKTVNTRAMMRHIA